MTLHCPVCRAENTTGSACRRCRADLSLLSAVEARRNFHVNRARTALRDGDFGSAASDLAEAAALRDGPDVRRLVACRFILSGDFRSALAASNISG